MKYIHTEKYHNIKAPKLIVDLFLEFYQPKSVVDVGCGIGTFLHCFKEKGINEVLGIDGDWVDPNLISKYLKESEFLVKDLEKPFMLNKKFDLVISLEVAEHLRPEYADQFIETLINLGDIILFSAAIPGQGGTNHLNEQWPSYWQKKFNKHGFIFHDIFRPLIWENEDIFFWYRQNIFVVSKEHLKPLINIDSSIPNLDTVHPELFSIVTGRLSQILTGKKSYRFYIKLILRHLLTKLRN